MVVCFLDFTLLERDERERQHAYGDNGERNLESFWPVAPISVASSNHFEGAPGPSLLGTGVDIIRHPGQWF